MQPRPEVLAFLEDIKENPEDDTPRLIFADWLEERDDPRGSLIRVQCELASTPYLDRRRTEVKKQETTLIGQVARMWPGPLSSLIDLYEYRRGLLWVGCSAAKFVAAAVDEMINDEAWAWVEGLVLWKVQPAHLVPLANSPLLRRILTINCYGNRIGPTGTQALVRSPWLGFLTTLRLGNNAIGVGGAEALAESETMPRLRDLYLPGNSLGDAGVEALAASPAMTNLRRLNLANNRITRRGARALAASTVLTNLERLDVRDNNCRRDGLQLLRQAYGSALVH
jgi:uncharacterized protein (TIGR02996 family)